MSESCFQSQLKLKTTRVFVGYLDRFFQTRIFPQTTTKLMKQRIIVGLEEVLSEIFLITEQNE